MATSDFAILAVENTGGVLALKRKNAADVVPESASPVIGAASGSMAAIPDAAGERVFRSVSAAFEPEQSGTGDPTPDNVRPITGRTAVRVTRCGKNMLPNVTRAVNAANVMIGQTASYTAAWDIHLAPGTYTVSAALTKACYLKYINKDGTISGNSTLRASPSVQITVPAEDDFAFWIYLSGGVVPDDIISFQLERGSAATDYEPYAGAVFDVSLPAEASPAYGGTADAAKGVLTVKKIVVDMGTLTWSKATQYGHATFYAELPGGAQTNTFFALCSHYKAVYDIQYTTDNIIVPYGNAAYQSSRVAVRDDARASMTAAQFKTAVSGAQLVYELAEPVEYTFTPVPIPALAGLNNVWADCGPVEVEYVRDTGAAIEAGDASTRAMIGEASGETASRSLAVGEYVAVGDKLYRVTSAVGAGETLVPGSNVTETTVGAELSRLAAMIS